MAIFATPRAVPFGAITTLNVVHIFDTIIAKAKTWNATRKTTNVLFGLTDRQLDDIGLARGQINTVSYTMATRQIL
ncbi:MAG: DUF1127 domain-containing protein [Paracoccaceae bacterium]